jgi:hypothetical protein
MELPTHGAQNNSKIPGIAAREGFSSLEADT